MTELNLVDSLARESRAYCLVTTEIDEEERRTWNQETTRPSLTDSPPPTTSSHLSEI